MTSGKGLLHLRAFTIVELLICIGIVLLLIGLFVPAISKSRSAARMSRDVAILNHCTTLVHLYCADFRGVFPTVGADMLAPRRWWQAASPDGTAVAVDPVGVRELGYVRPILSACFVVSPEFMQPGRTLPVDLVPIQAMTDASVTFPSQKGAFYMQPRLEAGREVYWNMVPAEYARAGPVSFLDGAAIVARWPDFEVNPAFFEYWVGMPVYATWHGAQGRDVLRPRG